MEFVQSCGRGITSSAVRPECALGACRGQNPYRRRVPQVRARPNALLHHSDRGSQYTSEQFQKLMADHGVICSMSRSGNVWDNAAMESFFSSLKIELKC